ncbi:MAG: thermonuclease family protein [Pseudomonadota bacterium]
MGRRGARSKYDDGFEWREYVRTTILLRRRERQERRAAATDAALGKAVSAGQFGMGAVAGFVGRLLQQLRDFGARVLALIAHPVLILFGWLGTQLRSLGAAAGGVLSRSSAGFIRLLRSAFAAGWTGVVHGWRSLCQLFVGGWAHVMQPLSSARATEFGRGLGQDRLPIVLRFAGYGLIGAGLARIAFDGLDVFAGSAIVLGISVATLASRGFSRLGHDIAGMGPRVRASAAHLFSRFSQPALPSLARVSVAVLACMIGAGLYTVLPNSGVPDVGLVETGSIGQANTSAQRVSRSGVPLPERAPSTSNWAALDFSQFSGLNFITNAFSGLSGHALIEGRARVMSGDTLVIGDSVIKLAGIDAPVRSQTCQRPRARRWRCGVAAERALRRLVGRGQLTCEPVAQDGDNVFTARCSRGATDLAERLVQRGFVFADASQGSDYLDLQEQARAAKRGIWRGEAQHPSAFRQKRWQQAKTKSPDGCPIKGRMHTKRGKFYLTPWSVSYERYRVRERRGDRWFCSEQEALQAGWRPVEQS